VDAVDVVNTVDMLDLETVTKVSALIAKLTAILQMDEESANTRKREETMEMMSTFASCAGSQATSKSIASPTHV
jgi:DNA uptake protein ComE-like DNA-binding protein